MPDNPKRYYDLLINKLTPSFLIQRRGSSQIPIRNSSTFGPQINAIKWGKAKGSQKSPLTNQLDQMNQ